MSDVVSGAPFKKPVCGDLYTLGIDKVQAHLRDVLGGLINLQIVGTDPDLVTQPVDGAAMTEDYAPGLEESVVNPGYTRVNPDGTFFITIETDAATYSVVLADGTQFTITPAQSTAYLGQWYPARLWKVLMDGTTGSFSVGY
jgi:hypothetical protein